MLATIGHVFTEALERGATLIRLLGNIGWGYHGWRDEKDLLRFEARVTCAAFETDPLTFFRNLVRVNSQYVEADAFVAGLRADNTP